MLELGGVGIASAEAFSELAHEIVPVYFVGLIVGSQGLAPVPG